MWVNKLHVYVIFPITNPRRQWKANKMFNKCSNRDSTTTHATRQPCRNQREQETHNVCWLLLKLKAKRERAMWKFFSSKNISTIHKIYLTRKQFLCFCVLCRDADFSFSIYICCSLREPKYFLFVASDEWMVKYTIFF